MNLLNLSFVIPFVISIVISGVIIFIVTKLLGETEGIITAFLAALIGVVIHSLSLNYLGNTLLSSVITIIVWLFALRALYSIGWLKSILVALLIGIVNILFEIYLLAVLIRIL